jgi:hypothetical protein
MSRRNAHATTHHQVQIDTGVFDALGVASRGGVPESSMGDAASIEGCPEDLVAAELGIVIVCCVSGLPVGDPVCDIDNCRLDFEPIESWEMINLAEPRGTAACDC